MSSVLTSTVIAGKQAHLLDADRTRSSAALTTFISPSLTTIVSETALAKRWIARMSERRGAPAHRRHVGRAGFALWEGAALIALPLGVGRTWKPCGAVLRTACVPHVRVAQGCCGEPDAAQRTIARSARPVRERGARRCRCVIAERVHPRVRPEVQPAEKDQVGKGTSMKLACATRNRPAAAPIPPGGTTAPGEIRCLLDGASRIDPLMASSAETLPTPRLMGLPMVSRASTRWIVRAPGRSGVLSPDEAAHALQARRVELRVAVERRKDARFLSGVVLDEVVDDAIAVVVMSRKSIQNEEHLQGAFWTSIGYLIAERRAGRHELRVGSRRRVAFEPLEGELAGERENEPFDFVEARDRVLRATDLISQLDPLERQVLAIMGGYGVGVKRAAKALGLPIKTVLAASRSANRKLDHVTAIIAAGRMCDYRADDVRALADGTALEEEAKIAQAHLDACSACRHEHVLLVREMASSQYKRAASAALLPAPPLLHAHGWLERLLTLAHNGRMPSGGGASAERAGLMLGGGAGAKIAVVAGVGVLAVAGAGVSAIHSLQGSAPPAHRRVVSRPLARTTAPPATTTLVPASEPGALPTTTEAGPAKPAKVAPTAKHPRGSRPPSQSLGYLALGDSPAATTSTAPAPSARAASTATGSEPAAETSSSSPPTPTGGGSLNYLGR